MSFFAKVYVLSVQGLFKEKEVMMKKLWVCLGLWVVLAGPVQAWQPSGWVYANYPYMYDHATQDWYWFGARNVQWTTELAGGTWARLNESPLAQGWSWHNERYAYHSSTQTWHYFSFNGQQRCVNLRTGVWSVFTTPPAGDYMVVDLSAGPDAATYPVHTYATPAAVPDGVAHDRYKTTHLLLRRIPAGTFTLGSPTGEVGQENNEDQRQVTLTKDFYMGVYEVTQKQWERVMGDWPSDFNNVAHRDARPVQRVTWNDARGGVWPGEPAGAGAPDAGTFVGRLRARTGLPFDLPTGAQWEFACRAWTTKALNSGKNLTDLYECPNVAEVGRYWFNGGSGYTQGGDASVGTAKVGSYLPNGWGLYDMHGNVWEWCLDWYAETPQGTTDPVGAATGSIRVVRGGSYLNDAGRCRSAGRYFSTPSLRSSLNGFRLSRTLP